ncbi:MAG: amidohydrolase family protein [Actinobacteria bacterium]|nr:amidohydrolase family protein [Actinomycetota bacterium]
MLAVVPQQVLDPATGELKTNVAIQVADDRIEAVTSADSIPEGTTRIDLPGQTILPGLIDCHTHLVGDIDAGRGYASLVTRSGAQEVLIGVKHASEMLRAGFTTVRDVGTFRAFADVALRDAIEAGWVEGPRMICAGTFVSRPGGGGDITGLAIDVDQAVPRELRFGICSGPDRLRALVSEIRSRGATMIKVIATGAVLTSGTNPGAPEFTEDELRAIVEEATTAGVFVAAHAHGAEGIKRAVRAGVRSVEHGSLMDDEAIAMLADTGTWLVADLYDGDYINEEGPRLGYDEETLRKSQDTTEAQRQGFEKCVTAGVKLAFGTDAGVFPHKDAGRQFAYLTRHGLTPLEAIRTATVHAAEMIGWNGAVGTLAPGARADLIGVQGNPLEDVSLLESVTWVMKGGVALAPEGGTITA